MERPSKLHSTRHVNNATVQRDDKSKPKKYKSPNCLSFALWVCKYVVFASVALLLCCMIQPMLNYYLHDFVYIASSDTLPCTANKHKSGVSDLNVAVVTVYDRKYSTFMRQGVLANHKAYAKKHGYTYVPVTGKDLWKYPGFKTICKKVAIVNDVLSRFDWVIFIDADACFFNMESFERIMKSVMSDRQHNAFDYDMVIGQDGIGLNGGIYFIKNTDWSHAFLKMVSEEVSDFKYCAVKGTPEGSSMRSILHRNPDHLCHVRQLQKTKLSVLQQYLQRIERPGSLKVLNPFVIHAVHTCKIQKECKQLLFDTCKNVIIG